MTASPQKEHAQQLRAKLLHGAAVLFIRNGYSNTSVEDISNFVGQERNNAFFRTFKTKENALLELMPFVLNAQFNLAEKLLGEKASDPVFTYVFDTAAEYYVAEESEALRDLYLAVYTLPETSQLIYKMMAPRLFTLFGDYLPGYEEKDFYELDIATASIIRGYLSVKCDMYFTLQQKIRRSTEATLRVLRVPEKKIREAIDAVLAIDMTAQVREEIQQLIISLAENDMTKDEI